MPLPWSLNILSIGVAGGAGGPCLLMMPHRADSQNQPLAIRGGVTEAPSGARVVDKDPALPIGRHEFEFRCETRDEVAFLEAWFDAREGKRGPFWFPTWQWEFELTGYIGGTVDGQLWARRWNDRSYAQYFAVSTLARRLVVVRGSQYKIHTVTAVTESVSPGVDLLTLKANDDSLLITAMGAGPSLHDDSYRPLWLRYGRFDQDELVVEEANGDGAAIVRVALIDLPEEVPT